MYVSRTEDYEPFDYVEVSEGGPAQFCLVVWGPLSETLHVHVETTDSGYAVGKFVWEACYSSSPFDMLL